MHPCALSDETLTRTKGIHAACRIEKTRVYSLFLLRSAGT